MSQQNYKLLSQACHHPLRAVKAISARPAPHPCVTFTSPPPPWPSHLVSLPQGHPGKPSLVAHLNAAPPVWQASQIVLRLCSSAVAPPVFQGRTNLPRQPESFLRTSSRSHPLSSPLYSLCRATGARDPQEVREGTRRLLGAP